MTLAELDEARRQGKKPAVPVVLALTPCRPPDEVPVIPVRSLPGDLRCVVDLEVIVAALPEQSERAVELVDRCLRFHAKDVHIWPVGEKHWVRVDMEHQRWIGKVTPRF